MSARRFPLTAGRQNPPEADRLADATRILAATRGFRRSRASERAREGERDGWTDEGASRLEDPEPRTPRRTFSVVRHPLSSKLSPAAGVDPRGLGFR